MEDRDSHKFLSQIVKTKVFLRKMGLEVSPETAKRYTLLLLSIPLDKENWEDISRGIFSSDYNGQIIEKDIPIFSYCEHHILPWFGQVHIGYIAHGLVLGISKFTRIVNYYSAGLTIQEDVTKSIADFFTTNISPDVIVIIEAIHTCKVARGVENPFSRSLTIDARGLFRESLGPRLEFFQSIGFTRHQY